MLIFPLFYDLYTSLCACMSAVCRSIPKRVTSVFRLFDLTSSCPLSSLVSSRLKTFGVYFTLFLSPASFSSLNIYTFSLSVLPLPLFSSFYSSPSLYSGYVFLHFSARLLIRFLSSALIPPHYNHLTKEILEVSLQ